jgi:two-component system OmpR family response regulator
VSATPHILVIDDARDIRDPLVRYLNQNGYRATAADGAAAARRILKTNAIDLIVLDIMMPGEDGLAFTRWLRSESETPVILLTARAEQVDKIVGLEMGADDYVPKPFNPRELVARIAAVLRRSKAVPKPAGERPQKVKFDRWILDTGQRELIGADGVAIPLSSGEFKLLQALMERPGLSLTRDQLLDITQGRNADSFDRAIDNAISRLRRKIEVDPKNPRIIKTVWGGGYVFVADAAAA